MTSEIRQFSKGEVFTVDLIENPSTGFVWRLKSPVFEIYGVRSTVDPTKPFEDLCGAPMIKTFHLKSNQLGEHELVFNKIRPWEKNSEPLEVFSETIVIF